MAGSIAMYISMTSISGDLKNQIDQSISNSNVDVIIQQRGSSTPVSSRINEDLVIKVEKLKEAKSVSSIIVGSTQTKDIPYLYLFGTQSIRPNLPIVKWLGNGIIEGKLFNSGQNEIIIGNLAAKRLKKGVGDTIILGATRKFVISGIYWIGQGILDCGAIMNIDDSQSLLKREGYINLIIVETHNKNDIASFIKIINEAFPSLKATPASSIKNKIRAISMIDSVIAAISSVALLLSGVLILNTLLMAVSERTREIGIMMAIGWSRFMIIKLIITEALLVGFFGGILGFVIAYPILYLVKFLPAIGTGWVPTIPSINLLFISILLSSGIAVISSIYPALFATRLVPAVALRYE